VIFFPGIPEPAWAHRFETAFISVSRLRRRKGPFPPPRGMWAMDSAAFTEVVLNGGYRDTPEAFAAEAAVWTERVRGCAFVASQDFMCEAFVLEKTGLSVVDHQRLTIERYDAIKAAWSSSTPLLPVLQGFGQSEYLHHIDDYGDRLGEGAWVGVGSVCKRQGAVAMVEDLLGAIKHRRPDLRLHGFGVKLTALKSQLIRDLLYSADSMAWSYAARRQGRDPNDWREAVAFADRVAVPAPAPEQMSLWGWS
jgi:hypothetical protein